MKSAPTKLAAAMLFIVVGAALACGEGDGGDDSEYYSEFIAANERFGDRIDAAGDIEGEEAQAEEGEDAYRDFIDEIGGLDPPPEAAEVHADLVDSFEELFALASEQRTDPDATNIQRAIELGERITGHCQEIEALAVSHGEAAEIFCAEED